jgi:hypothetical protein
MNAISQRSNAINARLSAVVIGLSVALTGCGHNPIEPGPTAVLSIPSSALTAGSVVSFDASHSLGTGLSYTIDYGDHTSDGPQSSASFNHLYRDRGTFTATLTVRDRLDRTSTDAKPVNINAPLVACGQVLIDGAPGDLAQAAQTMQTAIRDSSGVTVDATCSTGSGLTYSVSWGDGQTTGPQSNPYFGSNHVYGSNGNYTVTLTARDQTGASASWTGLVPVIDFSGRWVNTIFNPSTNRSETRYLELTQSANRTISGTYTHPEGNSESLHGSIRGTRGLLLQLTTGAIQFYTEDSWQEQLSSNGKSIAIEIIGGSADGMVLTFSRF